MGKLTFFLAYHRAVCQRYTKPWEFWTPISQWNLCLCKQIEISIRDPCTAGRAGGVMADDMALGAGGHSASAAWKPLSAGTAPQAGVAETEQEQVALGVTARGCEQQGTGLFFWSSWKLTCHESNPCLSLSPSLFLHLSNFLTVSWYRANLSFPIIWYA